jgi:hypothetical protein
MAQGVFTAWEPAAAKVGERGSLATVLLWVQGPYYLLTGVWPLVSIRTFQLVTGPKTDHQPTGLEADHWLVMTVGVLVTAIAVALLTAAWRRSTQLEIAVLAIGSALGLTAIDVIYVARQVIAPIYLVDAAVEIMLIAGWTVDLWQRTRS